MKTKLQISILAGVAALALTYLTRSVTLVTNPLVIIPAICAAAAVYFQTKANTKTKLLLSLTTLFVSFGLTKLAERIIGMFNPYSPSWSAIGPELVYGFIVTSAAAILVLSLSAKIKKS